MSLTRKEFLNSVVSAVAGAAGAAVLVACGSSGSSTPDSSTTPNCLMNGTNPVIGGNHGHTLMVSKAEVSAGVDKTYDITGSSGHLHNVTVTAAMFTMLKNNTTVTTTSTSGGTGPHTHPITIMCA